MIAKRTHSKKASNANAANGFKIKAMANEVCSSVMALW